MSYQFRDPIHGMIFVSDKEAELIKLPPFQRLRYIHQLGTTYLVYHGAEHTRFGHSLGVMHLISKAMDSLWERGYLKPLNKEEFERLKQIGRIVGLLHDVGHAPFSHVGEETGLYPKLIDIDGEEKSGHEVYTRLLVRDYFGKYIDELFDDQNITKEDILAFLSGFVTDKRFYFLKDLINGQLDADRMDYLLRDSYYCGVQYGKYDLHRLLDTLCICYPDSDPAREWQLGVESDGVHAVEEFIFARYWMFIQVYFHKTRRIYDYYLTEFIKSIMESKYKSKTYPCDLKEYLSWNDNRILQLIEEYGRNSSNKWASNIYTRSHLKEAFVSKPHHEENEDELKDELGRIAWVIEKVSDEFKEEYKEGKIYIDQAKTSSSKYLIEIPKYVSETQFDEDKKLYAIPIRDKLKNDVKPIQEISLPIENISDKKINILRIYAHEQIVKKVRDFANSMFEVGYAEYVNELAKKKKLVKAMKDQIKQIEEEIAKEESKRKERKKKFK